MGIAENIQVNGMESDVLLQQTQRQRCIVEDVNLANFDDFLQEPFLCPLAGVGISLGTPPKLIDIDMISIYDIASINPIQ